VLDSLFLSTSLQVLFGLPFGLAPSTSYSTHFFTESLSSFHNLCPYHHNLFCCSTKIISSNPSLSLNYTWSSIFYHNVTHPSDHSHLCPLTPLKWHIIFFSYRPGLTSMQQTTSHITAVQSPSHYQWYRPIFVGKQWYQLPEFVPSTQNAKHKQIHKKQNSNLNQYANLEAAHLCALCTTAQQSSNTLHKSSGTCLLLLVLQESVFLFLRILIKVKDNFNRYSLLALAIARCKQNLKLGTAILWAEHYSCSSECFCLLVLVAFSLGLW